jgi:hypothetical protein
MSRQLALALAAGALLSACSGPNMEQLQIRAAHDFDCPENQIRMTPLDENDRSWGLRGCGKSAAYSWTESSGAGEWVMTKKVEKAQ